MARPKSYTEQDIISAVQVITSIGKAVSGSSLRLQVGKGRPDALFADYEALIKSGAIKAAAKQQDLAVVTQELEQKPLPPEVADGLALLLGELESMIRACNDKAHSIHEQRVAGEIKQARQKTEIAQTEALEKEKELDKALLDLGIVEEERDEAAEQLDAAQREVKETKSALIDAHGSRDELARKCENLSFDLSAKKDELTQSRTRLELQATALAESKEEAKLALADSAAQREKLAVSLAKLEQENAHAEQENGRLAQSLKDAGAKAEQQSEQLKVLTDANTKLAVENEQIERLAKQNDEQSKQISALLEQLSHQEHKKKNKS